MCSLKIKFWKNRWLCMYSVSEKNYRALNVIKYSNLHVPWRTTWWVYTTSWNQNLGKTRKFHAEFVKSGKKFDYLGNCLVGCLVGWLINWLAKPLIDWLFAIWCIVDITYLLDSPIQKKGPYIWVRSTTSNDPTPVQVFFLNRNFWIFLTGCWLRTCLFVCLLNRTRHTSNNIFSQYLVVNWCLFRLI